MDKDKHLHVFKLYLVLIDVDYTIVIEEPCLMSNKFVRAYLL